eukprot:COSAG04_NODE_2561_length_3930_cov_1.897416_3_plen_98_part_00
MRFTAQTSAMQARVVRSRGGCCPRVRRSVQPHWPRPGPCAELRDNRGVSWSKGQQVWRAQIEVDGKGRHLGCFQDEEAAAKAYQAECRKIGRDPTGP